MSFFMAGNVRLLVGVPEVARARSSMVYFKVSDIHGVYKTLGERGVAFGAAPAAAPGVTRRGREGYM